MKAFLKNFIFLILLILKLHPNDFFSLKHQDYRQREVLHQLDLNQYTYSKNFIFKRNFQKFSMYI